jgi:hypothetical protein
MSNPLNFWAKFLIYLARSLIRSIIQSEIEDFHLSFEAIFCYNLCIMYDLDGTRNIMLCNRSKGDKKKHGAIDKLADKCARFACSRDWNQCHTEAS